METMGRNPPLDLTSEVTVFVATVGDKANYDDCIKHLEGQDCRFRFDVIDHVAPMSAAFQTMIDRCETPYYIQIDEDMILDEYAVRILWDAMKKTDSRTAIVCYSLYDEHMRQAIQGVKIYRHDILKRYPYDQTVPHCDVEQLERMKSDGCKVLIMWRGYERNITCIGRHGVHYTPETAYEAYYNRAMKSRMFPQWMSWSRRLLSDFHARVKADPDNTVDLYSMLCFAAGMTADLSGFDHEKDWRMRNHDFVRLQADLETSPPSQLNLHVTSKCNLNCSFCPRPTMPKKRDMDPSILDVVLQKCPSIKSVCIAGFGEPLLYAHLEKLVTKAKAKNLYTGLITNGVLLEDFAPILATWGVDSVSVSLNAPTAESHKRCNGTTTWDGVLRGIRKAVKLLPGRVAVSMVCGRNNLDKMRPFLELSAELGVSAVDFLNTLPHDGARDNPDTLYIDNAEACRTIQNLKFHKQANLVRTWPVLLTDDCPRRCQSPYVSLSVDSEGLVSPCRRVMAPSKKMGSIFAPCPPWRLPATYNLRATIEGDTPMLDVCKMCFGNWSG